MPRGELAARAAQYLVVPVKGHTLRLVNGVLLVGSEVPDAELRAYLRTLDRRDVAMTCG
jgi:hypothetical protein